MTTLIQNLQNDFKGLFKIPPALIVRVPGRVNIIGEHTDYNLLPVLPMAIDRHLYILVAPTRKGGFFLRNTNPQFQPVEFALSENIAPAEAGDWGNYARAVAQNGVRYARDRGIPVSKLKGMMCLVHGEIPPAAGLSSSTALVVGTGLAWHRLQGWRLNRKELALRLADAERYVGTRGGSMDHLTLLCSRSSHVMRIGFEPLEITHIPWRTKHQIVMANSEVRAGKSDAVRTMYNLRVAESYLATRIASKIIGHDLNYLGDLATLDPHPRAHKNIIKKIPAREMSLSSIASYIDTDEASLASLLQERFNIQHIPAALPIQRRMKFLLEEWERVDMAANLIRRNNIKALGDLLYKAHEGLKCDYEVTHPRVDELVACARKGGAIGARITGAGFGGCVLMLCTQEQIPALISHLKNAFYTTDKPPVFSVIPSAAASIRT